MKTRNSLMTAVMAVAMGGVVFTACNPAEELESNGIPSDVLAKFEQAGFVPSEVQPYLGNEFVTYAPGEAWLLEDDIVVTNESLDEIVANPSGVDQEQYRTSALVSSPRTISVTGLSNYGGGFDLSSTLRTGLQWAIDNYNRLNIGLSFTVSYDNNLNRDIVVYTVSGGGGGSAGFPSGGNPYKWVQIQSGTANYGNNVAEHVIGHEIGHCIGFRHTDYFNRSISCGSGGNEGSAGVGAIHIPGTPTTNTSQLLSDGSLMLACFSASEDGEFSNADITALNYLY